MGTRVPSCGETCELYIRYFVQIMKMNLKIKVFMKVETDDEIDGKDAAISSDHQDFWVFLEAVLNFSELILFPFFLDSCVKKKRAKVNRSCF